ncbi:MAG: glucosaminidase domain-containing protein [Clostridia bacterium]|nr:glucosaminidase domain-containing protein [Clostridia bacterium]
MNELKERRKSVIKNVFGVGIVLTIFAISFVAITHLKTSKDYSQENVLEDVATITAQNDGEINVTEEYDTNPVLAAHSFSTNTLIAEPSGVSRNDFIEYCSNMKYDTKGYFSRNAGMIWDYCHKLIYDQNGNIVSNGLNEYFVLGVAAYESNWGTSNASLTKNNAFGRRTAINKNVSLYETKFTEFDSDEECLCDFIDSIANTCLSSESTLNNFYYCNQKLKYPYWKNEVFNSNGSLKEPDWKYNVLKCISESKKRV